MTKPFLPPAAALRQTNFYLRELQAMNARLACEPDEPLVASAQQPGCARFSPGIMFFHRQRCAAESVNSATANAWASTRAAWADFSEEQKERYGELPQSQARFALAAARLWFDDGTLLQRCAGLVSLAKSFVQGRGCRPTSAS